MFFGFWTSVRMVAFTWSAFARWQQAVYAGFVFFRFQLRTACFRSTNCHPRQLWANSIKFYDHRERNFARQENNQMLGTGRGGENGTLTTIMICVVCEGRYRTLMLWIRVLMNCIHAGCRFWINKPKQEIEWCFSRYSSFMKIGRESISTVVQ